MTNTFKKIFSVGFLVSSAIVISAVMASRPMTLVGQQSIEIPPGASTRDIASELQTHHLIRSRYPFLLFAYANGSASGLQSGRYIFSGRLTISSIVEVLRTGRGVIRDVTITIPEGLRSDQIADLLVKKGVLQSSIEFLSLVRTPQPQWSKQFLFLASRPPDQGLEGFLFGDTYRFLPHTSASEVIRTMLETFELRMVRPNYPTSQADPTLYTTLITASILEQEVRSLEDRMMVADIFKKRIAQRIPLQADSTVNYITGRSDERARINDTLLASPYNTYRFAGLPPSPISNPSVSSFTAALHPRSNPYYFFLTDSSGVVHYGITFTDHQQNRNKFLPPPTHP